MFDNSFINRVLLKSLCVVLLPACMAWSAVAALVQTHSFPAAAPAAPELPMQWQGRPLRPLALGDVEERFARRFPGTLARLTDGDNVLVLRHVRQPTRMLHPATDCYQGLGYRVAAQQLELDAQDRLWRCFEAARGGRQLRVCERIVDAQGRGFTDTSAWYWAAALGQSQGPWQAITIARPL
jgi:hypothetical protein